MKTVSDLVIEDTIKTLRSTLRRHKEEVSAGMVGLLCGLVGHWARTRGYEEPMHPGIAKMAGWSGCKDRQTQNLVRQLEAEGVLISVGSRAGGRKAVRYELDGEVMVEWLRRIGVRLPESLLRRLANPIVRGATRGAVRGDTVAPGSYDDRAAPGRASGDLSTILMRSIQRPPAGPSQGLGIQDRSRPHTNPLARKQP